MCNNSVLSLGSLTSGWPGRYLTNLEKVLGTGPEADSDYLGSLRTASWPASLGQHVINLMAADPDLTLVP